MLCGQENHYFYNVVELKNAPWQKTITFIAFLSSRMLLYPNPQRLRASGDQIGSAVSSPNSLATSENPKLTLFGELLRLCVGTPKSLHLLLFCMLFELRPRKPLYLLCFWAQECSVPKKTIIFIAFLSSRMLRAQENHYIYSVFEFMCAPCPRKPIYLYRLIDLDQ